MARAVIRRYAGDARICGQTMGSCRLSSGNEPAPRAPADGCAQLTGAELVVDSGYLGI
jgi:hypothetical protein